MKSLTLFSSLTLLSKASEAVALPTIDPDTPIALNAFKLRSRAGEDPHAALGIDPETIRKYASQVPNPANLGKRVTEFDPEEQLIDGEYHIARRDILAFGYTLLILYSPW